MTVEEQTKARIRSIVERVELLEEEKAAIATDIKEVYAEAKSAGFDTATLRRIVKMRKMDESDRQEAEELTRMYADAVGLQGVLL